MGHAAAGLKETRAASVAHAVGARLSLGELSDSADTRPEA